MTTHPIHDRVLAFIADAAADRFEELALAVFAHQFESVPDYRRVCEARGRTPDCVRDWRDVPAVPTLAFKRLELRCAPAVRTFVSSGTTQGPEARSRHALPDLRLYHAAALGGLREFLFPDLERMPILSLIPTAAECPQSSLSQMAAWAAEAFGTPESATFAAGERLEFAALAAALRHGETSGEPVCLLATTAALTRFLEYCRDAGWEFRLPHGSRLMDTGGTKGVSRPLSRNGLLQAVWSRLAIPGYFVVNEYGMSELSSQFYDNVLRDRRLGRVVHRAKAGPHWVRTRVVDARGGDEVAAGESGLLCHTDLANAGTAVCVLTEDVGRIGADGFEILGRVAGAQPRGCSLTLAEFSEA